MTARLVVFDIETYRTRDLRAIERIKREALDKRPPGNAKREDKLAWDSQAARIERAMEAIDKTAVNVLLAEVLCVGWRADGDEQSRWCGVDECRGLEMLRDTWEHQTGSQTIWCGHNILGFDLPVLLNRWRRFGITPPTHFPQYNGRWIGRTYDTMTRTPCNNGLGMVSLDAVCAAYGVEGAKEMEWGGEPMCGARVGQVYEAGDFQAILDYCLLDVRVQETLYMVMTGNDTWGTYPREDDLAEQLAEIDAAGLSEGAKAIAKLNVLDAAGLLPRTA